MRGSQGAASPAGRAPADPRAEPGAASRVSPWLAGLGSRWGVSACPWGSSYSLVTFAGVGVRGLQPGGAGDVWWWVGRRREQANKLSHILFPVRPALQNKNSEQLNFWYRKWICPYKPL